MPRATYPLSRLTDILWACVIILCVMHTGRWYVRTSITSSMDRLCGLPVVNYACTAISGWTPAATSDRGGIGTWLQEEFRGLDSLRQATLESEVQTIDLQDCPCRPVGCFRERSAARLDRSTEIQSEGAFSIAASNGRMAELLEYQQATPQIVRTLCLAPGSRFLLYPCQQSNQLNILFANSIASFEASCSELLKWVDALNRTFMVVEERLLVIRNIAGRKSKGRRGTQQADGGAGARFDGSALLRPSENGIRNYVADSFPSHRRSPPGHQRRSLDVAEGQQ